MKKIFFLVWVALLLPAILCAQEKIEAPSWIVGDKWVFTAEGTIEVVNTDQNSYVLKFSDGICIYETQGNTMIIFGKTNLNRVLYSDGGKRKKYLMGLSKALDFPLSIGKESKSGYSESVISSWSGHKTTKDFSEVFKVIGWDDVAVRAGRFKALKLEYKRILTYSSGLGGDIGKESRSHYWYSPDVKYFVKCQYDKEWMKANKDIFDWELTSFQLKK